MKGRYCLVEPQLSLFDPRRSERVRSSRPESASDLAQDLSVPNAPDRSRMIERSSAQRSGRARLSGHLEFHP